METNLKSKTVLVYDNGLFIELAVRLAHDFGKVYYYMPWKSAFPSSNRAVVGEGVEEIERVLNFWEVYDKVDLFVFPDVYDADLQKFLRSQGKIVWGNGDAEKLELNRWETRKLQHELGIAAPETKRIIGLDNLIELLKTVENKWLKISTFRADFETFHHINFFLSEPFLDNLARQYGAHKNEVEFILEDNIEGVEIGYDGWTVDGEYPRTGIYGYEIKDLGYIGKVASYGDMPEAIVSVNKKLAGPYRQVGARGFVSTEVRVNKERIFYLTDPCIRCGSPPTEGTMEMYSNLSEIIWEGANGRLIIPKPEAKFCIIAMMHSTWANTNWMPVKFPKEMRRWIKFRNLAVVGGHYYAVPQGWELPEIGAVVGRGETLEEAIKMIDSIAEEVEGYTLEIHNDSMIKAQEAIAEGKRYGINF